eukprot:420552_1
MANYFILLLTILSVYEVALCEIQLNGIFGDHMVLQTKNSSNSIPATNIYGLALLNETVFISGSEGFPSQIKIKPSTNQTNSKYGNWSATIDIDTTSTYYPGPFIIYIKSINNNNNIITSNITLNDIYFGDVWICSGQSNMEYTVNACDNHAQEMKYADMLPNIRLFQVNKTLSNYTQQNLTSLQNKGWQIANNQTILSFSCICWTTARFVAQWFNDTKRYFGLIESDWGGTTVHFWAAGDVGVVCNSTHLLPSSGECANGNAPGAIFNAMINPLSMNGNGISIRQLIWYQGEADTGENDLYSQLAYECELFGLINSWRRAFNIQNLSFINIQLPANGGALQNDYLSYDNGFIKWDAIQSAQFNVYKMSDNSGLVTGGDTGQNKLHYPHKIDIAKRASLFSRYLTYDDNTLIENGFKKYDGPKFEYAYKLSNELGVGVVFSNVGPKGLYLRPAYNCSSPLLGNGTLYMYNKTEYECCDLSGANSIKLRLEGSYYVYNEENKRLQNYLWNWMPANITFLNDNLNTIIVKPILPQENCYGFPNSQSIFKYIQSVSIKQIALQMSSRCAISNVDNDIPLNSKDGIYQVLKNYKVEL